MWFFVFYNCETTLDSFVFQPDSRFEALQIYSGKVIDDCSMFWIFSSYSRLPHWLLTVAVVPNVFPFCWMLQIDRIWFDASMCSVSLRRRRSKRNNATWGNRSVCEFRWPAIAAAAYLHGLFTHVSILETLQLDSRYDSIIVRVYLVYASP